MGSTYADLGDLDSAVINFQKAIALRPELAETHTNLANTLSLLGYFMDAIESYNRSLSVQPNDKDTLYLLGNTLLDVGHHKEGLKYQREARGVIEFGTDETTQYQIVSKVIRNTNDD